MANHDPIGGPIWARLRFALAALLTACDETGSDDDDPYAVEEIVASESSEFFDGVADQHAIEGSDTDDDTQVDLELDLRTSSPVGCAALDDLDSCADAGCQWLDTFGVVVDTDAGTCEIGDVIGLCYPNELGQPCADSSAHCDDGDALWALSGPDGGLLIARSTNSCGVAEGFVPCGSELLDDTAALACDCACD